MQMQKKKFSILSSSTLDTADATEAAKNGVACEGLNEMVWCGVI
jgi:hypothetical protein